MKKVCSKCGEEKEIVIKTTSCKEIFNHCGVMTI